MSNKDDHLIYESYIRPAKQETADDILMETIDHIITALEGNGMLKIVAKPDRGSLSKILKQKFGGSVQTFPYDDEHRNKAKEARKKMRPYMQGGPHHDQDEGDEKDDREDFKTRLLRAIAQAGDSDLNMPFEEKEKPDLNGDGENDFEDVKIARKNAAAKASSKSE